MTGPDRVPMSRAEVLDALNIVNSSLSRTLRKTRERLNAGMPLRPWDMPLPEPGGWWWSDDIAGYLRRRDQARASGALWSAEWRGDPQ